MSTLLQINATSNWGSTGRIAESIGVEAIKCGWNSYIAYGRHCNPSKSVTIKIGNGLATYLHYAFHKLLDGEGLGSLFSTKRLIRKIKSISPDVILLHNLHDHYLNYKVLFNYLNSTNIPVVWTFHDCWAITGHCNHFVKTNCLKWQHACDNCPQNKHVDRSKRNFALKKRLFSTKNNLTIISCSYWIDNFVAKSFMKEKKHVVIHNGIDSEIFKPETDCKLSHAKFKVLAVSNVWLPYKGINDIYKLREMLPDEFEITIVGLSLQQIQQLPCGIIGIQKTQNVQELVRLYSDADVFINPTYIDNFPTVNIEALSCGTPVITYRTGGSPEAIDENTGIVVEQGDVDAMADAIKQMKEHPLNSLDCRSRAISLFDKSISYSQYITLIKSLIE